MVNGMKKIRFRKPGRNLKKKRGVRRTAKIVIAVK
jgi:hypothetical protein